MTEQTKKISDRNRLLEGPIWKGLLFFFFPLLLGTFFQTLYNTVDAVIVGRFIGKEGLSAVGGASAMLISLLVGFFVGVSSGATVVISQSYGSGDHDAVEKAVHTAIALALAGGMIMTLLCFFAAPPFLVLMDTPAETLADSRTYLQIYALGMIPNMLYNMASGILRAAGDSKRPTLYLILGCLLNIVLDLFFISGLHLGVAGAAAATCLSVTFSAALMLITLIRTSDSYRLRIPSIRFEPRYLHRIIGIGIPAGIRSSLYMVSNIVIQTAINGFGTDAVAAWASWGKIDAMFWMVMSSFGSSLTTFTGQNYGAGRSDRIRSGVRTSSVIVACLAVTFSVFFRLTRIPLIRLFSSDPGVIKAGAILADGITTWYLIYAPLEILSSTLIGLGDALIPTVITVVGVCAVRTIWCMTAVPYWHTLTSITLNYPISWAITSIAFIFYFRKRIRRFLAETS